MTENKIFISSVIKGFETERAAARKAVESLNQRPIMAEDFGARPSSAQNACLDGVRESDIYVGVFGERYGYRQKSGVSATEEEFREAENMGMDMLCFIWNGQLEPEQEEFVKSIKNYERGKTIAHYSSADDLRDKITSSLHSHTISTLTGEFDVTAASGRLTPRLVSGPRRSNIPELRVALIPERQTTEYLTPADLGDTELRDSVAQLLLFGEQPRLLDQTKGLHKSEGEDFFRFSQGRNEEDFETAVSFYSDGTIAMVHDISGVNIQDEFAMMRGSILDEQYLANSMTAFLRFARQYYESVEAFRRANSFYFWMHLGSVQHMQLGRLPKRPRGFSMRTHGLGDPLCMPDSPKSISRKKLYQLDELVNDFVSRLVRKFKAADVYYEIQES
jgi:hypothetical protein